MPDSNITTSLSLMRRMPPNKVEQNLSGLLNLLPDDQDELLQRIDQPLQEVTDPVSVRSCRNAPHVLTSCPAEILSMTHF